jgi:hypothetical protein
LEEAVVHGFRCRLEGRLGGDFKGEFVVLDYLGSKDEGFGEEILPNIDVKFL